MYLDKEEREIYENDLKPLRIHKAEIRMAEEKGENKKAFEIAEKLLDVLDNETIAIKIMVAIDQIEKLKIFLLLTIITVLIYMEKGFDFMDIELMSVYMHQASVDNQVSISLTKMMMDNQTQTASQMTDMMKNMAVDTSRGANIDIRV